MEQLQKRHSKTQCSYQLAIGDSKIKIEVTKKKVKNLRLVVRADGEVRISAPLWLEDKAIAEFAVSKLNWIKNKQAQFQALPRLKLQYLTGESHYFRGKSYLLNVIERDAAPKVVLNSSTIYLYVRRNSTTQQREKVLTQWYRQQLKTLLPDIIAKWETRIGVKTNDWGVKKMKTRWGTCNTVAKRIWLNLELIKKPTHCLEYVVVHELVHLLERGHGDRFKAYMTQFMPHWKSYQTELNKSFQNN